MRLLGSLVLSCLLPTVALADGVTAVDDEPVSHDAAHAAAARATPARVDPRLPSDVGEFRGASVAAPTPSRVDDRSSVAREHDVAPAHAVTAAADNDDVMAELAARQMKRHQRALDLCVAAAHKRAPAAAGSLTLDFDIADRKVKSVRVTDDGVHDSTLASCVTQVARGFSFSLAAAHFRWPVAVR